MSDSVYCVKCKYAENTVKIAPHLKIPHIKASPHSLASKLQRPISWEVDIPTTDPYWNIHLSLVGRLSPIPLSPFPYPLSRTPFPIFSNPSG